MNPNLHFDSDTCSLMINDDYIQQQLLDDIKSIDSFRSETNNCSSYDAVVDELFSIMDNFNCAFAHETFEQSEYNSEKLIRNIDESGEAAGLKNTVDIDDDDDELYGDFIAGSSADSNGISPNNFSNVKKKIKVDWTPELHQKFVKAVEQLGLDKAIPSKILEIMGVKCLTRHNVASHLQKYRWHTRKQWLESTSSHGGGPSDRGGASTINYRPRKRRQAPAVAGPAPPGKGLMHVQQRTQLHVWGHPACAPLTATVRGFSYSTCRPPPNIMIPLVQKYWSGNYHPLAPAAAYNLTSTPQKMPQNKFPSNTAGAAHFCPNSTHVVLMNSTAQRGCRAPLHLHAADAGVITDTWTSSSSSPATPVQVVAAAINEVIRNPYVPLPLGLKPPSVDSVVSELQKQGHLLGFC